VDTIPGLNDLRARREALLLESELNRQALRLEVIRIELTIDRLRRGIFSGQNVWKWVAPVAGFVIARKFGSSASGAKTSAFFAIGQTLWNAWKERRRAAPRPDPGKSGS
jgi:hypothetical protein